MSVAPDLEKLIGSRKPVIFRSRPDFARWQTYLDRKGVTTFLFLDDSSVEKNTEIYHSYKRKNGIPQFPVCFYSASSFVQDPEVIEILGNANIEYVKEAVVAFEERTFAPRENVNGVAIYLARGGRMTAPHVHVYDSLWGDESQLAIWANEHGRLPTFWFEIDGQKHHWPDLSSSNSYYVDGRYTHAGDATDGLTIYLVGFCRKHKTDQ